MKKQLILLSFVFIANFSLAQYNLADFTNISQPSKKYLDTIGMIEQMPESNDKAMLQVKAFTYYFYSNADSALYFAKKVEAYAEKHEIRAMQIFNHLFIGQHYVVIKGNYALGLYYINLSIEESLKYNTTSEFFAGSTRMVQIGCYAGLGSYTRVKNILNNGGKNAIRQAYVRENVWTPDGMIGQFYSQVKEYDSAIKYATNAIRINDTMPMNLKWGFPYIVLSEVYLQKAAYDKALSVLHSGKEIITANNFDKDKAESHTNYARAYFGLQNYDSAIYYANAAYYLSDKIKLTNTVLAASILLSKIYKQINQIDSSFKYLSIGNEIKDELTDKSRTNEIENITLNETIRENQIIEEAAARKKLIYGLGSIFIIGFVGLIIFNKYKIKSRIRQEEAIRKNKELKAAKDLQLSLLPRSNPKRADLDIATFIRSSTEVGGDYYDFDLKNDGTIVSICGDATGHGVASGMMVSVTKAGLKGIGGGNPSSILTKLNNVVKDVDLGTLRMSLNIVEIKAHELAISSAAMPPIYLFQAKTNNVVEFNNNGLPLGGLRGETFKEETIIFESGDVLIQLSDGLPEAPNLLGELYDYDRLKLLIQNSGRLSAQEIVNTLIASVDQWMEGKHNPDDITIVVTKKK